METAGVFKYVVLEWGSGPWPVISLTASPAYHPSPLSLLIPPPQISKNFSYLVEIGASIKYFSIREVEMEGCLMAKEIKVAPMHKLIKRAGAARVSEESAIALGRALEEIGVKVASEAIDFAVHAGRKTVKARDIEIAAQKVLSR